MTKKKTKKGKAYYRNKLDKKFSELVRSRGRCEFCGRADVRLECAHIQSRRYVCIRWDLRNALCLCSACHFKSHAQPLWFADHIQPYKKKYLKEKIQNLKAVTIQDMQAKYEELKKLTN